MEPDHKGPGEFFKFALKRLPDDLESLSIVVGTVFGAVWFFGALFKRPPRALSKKSNSCSLLVGNKRLRLLASHPLRFEV